MRPICFALALSGMLGLGAWASGAAAEPLAGTAALVMEGDITSELVDGADRFLLRKLQESIGRRAAFWNRDFSSAEKYAASVEPNRKRLAHILGVRDARVAFDGFELLATSVRPACVGEGQGYKVYAVRWPTIGDVACEGLLLVPAGQPVADVVAVPDADQTPEMLAGLVEGVARESQFARRLAESGCRVLVPTLVDRGIQPTAAKLTNREFIYRAAFEMGRHVIGYEVQAVLAVVDHFDQQRARVPRKIGVIGWGQGGQIALAAAALDPRIDAACVSGYFDSRQNVWQETLDRNVFGFLEQFGDAELATLIAPRPLVIEAAAGPQFEIPPGGRGGPGKLGTAKLASVRAEVARAKTLLAGLNPPARIELVASGDGAGAFGAPAALGSLLAAIAPGTRLAAPGPGPKSLLEKYDPAPRQQRLVYQLNRHTQRLWAESAEVRRTFFAKLDTKSLAGFQKTVEPYRTAFYNEVIGRFDETPLPPRVRTRKSYDTAKYTGYEVVMDVFPDVIAYGILLMPKDIRPGQRRPVVVCQHGLEGRPQDVLAGSREGERYYSGFASALADQGFITFAPQNLYIFKDRFRTLQRKGNLLGKTLFSLIVPQHQQIVDWLGTLAQVDPRRIAFYGLSYGGKSAMRIPPLVKNYCLSICSGDFNEWIWKNVSVGNRYTYMNTGEYEIFEFDLGNTFNYAEMAALICPRPFMVERGHFDGCSCDEMVAYEFAKVRFLYQAQLKIGDRVAIEWFPGPHKINGVATYAFLHKWLDWPAR